MYTDTYAYVHASVCIHALITYVTGPAKIGYFCTQNLALFLKFNLQYLLKYKYYDNDIFMTNSKINKKVKKIYRT